jgi:YegS/Rv2252/BmrU family lipid kinase
MDAPPVLALINPAAGAGRARKQWPRHAQALRVAGVELQEHWTTQAHEATLVVQHAWNTGTRRFIAVGGDGTVNEVLNGLAEPLTNPDEPRPWMAVAPCGTGNDWARQLGLPRSAQDWAAVMAGGTDRPHDVGRLRFADGRVQYFAVEAGAGFDTHVLGLLSRRGPRQLAYVSALVRGLFSFKGPALHLQLHSDGGSATLGSARSMVAFGCIGPKVGGGMHVAPGARDDDGLLDFVTVADAGPWYNLLSLPKLFNGRLHQDSNVQFARAARGDLVLDPPMAVQCDGQIAGTTPVTFDLLPAALRVPGLPCN